MKKRILALTLAVCLLYSCLPALAAPQRTVRVLVNGAEVAFEVPPVIIDGLTFVPVRDVCEMLGAKVIWNNETQSAILYRSNTDLTLTIGDDKMKVFNQIKRQSITVPLPAAPRLISGKTMLPIRPVVEQFGGDIYWDQNSYTITIDDPYTRNNHIVLYYDEFPDVPNFIRLSGVVPYWEMPSDDALMLRYDYSLLSGDEFDAFYAELEAGGYKPDDALGPQIGDVLYEAYGDVVDCTAYTKDNSMVLKMYFYWTDAILLLITSDRQGYLDGLENLESIRYADHTAFKLGETVEAKNYIVFNVRDTTVNESVSIYDNIRVELTVSLSPECPEESAAIIVGDFALLAEARDGSPIVVHTDFFRVDGKTSQMPIEITKGREYQLTLTFHLPYEAGYADVYALVMSNRYKDEAAGRGYRMEM